MYALERILRFRRLTEQQARRELERATQRLRAATAASERQSKIVVEQRASLAYSWIAESFGRNAEASEASADEWLLDEAALEFSGWNRAQLEQVCAIEAQRIEPLVAHYIECRRALLQTERLVEQQAELARVEQERRMQAESDEWFLQQNLRRGREERRADGQSNLSFP